MKQIRVDTGICHIRVDRTAHLREFLLSVDYYPLRLKPTPQLVDEWLHYGSVYIDGRRAQKDLPLKKDQVIRLHTRRKTYLSEIPDLLPRIVLDHPDFLVLDKPSGLPTHATLDNAIENAAHLLREQTGHPVFVTHRLDVGTQGLLILAKSPKAQAALNKQFAKRQVRKIYRARTRAAVPVGLHEHFMDPKSRVPKVIAVGAQPGWWDCRLNVESCAPDGDDFLVNIELLTGRTHQIRAQLAFLGAPINGDRVYGSTVRARDGQIDLECHELGWRWLQKDYLVRRPRGG